MLKLIGPNSIDQIQNYSDLSDDSKEVMLHYAILQIEKRSLENTELEILNFEQMIKLSKDNNEIKYTSEKDDTDDKTTYDYTLKNKDITMRCIDSKDIIKSIVQNSMNNKTRKKTKKFHTNPEKQIMKPMKKKEIKNFDNGVPFEELSLHNTPDDAWISIERNVYDITDYVRRHPGGKIILKYAGKEGTNAFNKHHHWVNHKYVLKARYIGRLNLI